MIVWNLNDINIKELGELIASCGGIKNFNNIVEDNKRLRHENEELRESLELQNRFNEIFNKKQVAKEEDMVRIKYLNVSEGTPESEQIETIHKNVVEVANKLNRVITTMNEDKKKKTNFSDIMLKMDIDFAYSLLDRGNEGLSKVRTLLMLEYLEQVYNEVLELRKQRDEVVEYMKNDLQFGEEFKELSRCVDLIKRDVLGMFPEE